MNIAGVIVDALPGHEQGVRRQLLSMPGVEVHGVADGRRLIVTVEGKDAGSLADALTGFHNMPGVISATMVYHHFEEDEEVISDETEQA